MSLTYPQSGRISGIHNLDRRRGSHIARQNDPAYNREVQYTASDRRAIRFSFNTLKETVRMLCKDQNLNIPLIPTTDMDTELTMTMPEFNLMLEAYMDQTTPLPRAQTIKTE